MSSAVSADNSTPIPVSQEAPATCAPAGTAEARQNVMGYVGTVVLTVLIVVYTLRLWHADPHVPFIYAGDNLLNQVLIQSMMENGWYLDNPRLGLPLPQNMRDFPLADTLHFALLKVLAWIFADSAVALNLYGLLTFPLVALSAYFVFRRFKFDRLLALVAAVLYACAPFHFARFVGHLFLAAYYMLPLMTLVMVRIYLGRSPFVSTDPHTGTLRWRLLSRSSVGAVLIAGLTGIAGVYYAFFSCFLLLVVGVKASFRDRRWAPVVSALLLIVVISVSVGAAVLPTLLYNAQHGANPAVAGRRAIEADIYGLSVAELLLPLNGHRFFVLRWIFEHWTLPGRQPTGEFMAVTLGTLGGIGLVWLIARFLWRRRDKVERIEDALAYLTVLAIMLGTLGGIGCLFNFYVTPMIRCYNRLSIYIAFFAVAGLFCLLQRWTRRYVQSKRSFGLYVVGSCVLCYAGIWDQTVKWFIPPYKVMQQEYASDVEFGKRMEAIMPEGAMIYQLPYVPFPEHAPVFAMPDYDLLRPYLHTKTLRWSYGAMKGREASEWQAALAERPLPEVVRTLAFAGFSGIYIDRAGLPDLGASAQSQLSKLLGVKPLVSVSTRQMFFDMSSYAANLKRRYNEREWQAKHDDALHPVVLRWSLFGEEELAPGIGYFRRCGSPVGEAVITNPQDQTHTAVLKMECSGWDEKPVSLVVDSPLVHKELRITSTRQPVELKLRIPPGEHTLRFICAGTNSPESVNPRRYFFRVWNVEWHVED